MRSVMPSRAKQTGAFAALPRRTIRPRARLQRLMTGKGRAKMIEARRNNHRLVRKRVFLQVSFMPAGNSGVCNSAIGLLVSHLTCQHGQA